MIKHGYSGAEAGRRLGINSNNIVRWVRQYRDRQEAAKAGTASPKELQAEIQRLRKENKRLQMEREILKKPRPSLQKNRIEIRFYPATNESLSYHRSL